MKSFVLLAFAATLAFAAPAMAVEPGPVEVLDLVYENATALSACVSTSAEGNVGLTVTSDPPAVVVTTPALEPPGPQCLVLPTPA